MNYKEENFEIDNTQIVFKTNPFVFTIAIAATISIFTSIGWRVIARDTTALIEFIILSLVLVLLIHRRFATFTKTKILLTDISKVEIKDIKLNAGKHIFRGTGQFRNYFPAGLNKKLADKLFFIYQKDKKVVIGFAPVNCAETASTLKGNGINVIG